MRIVKIGKSCISYETRYKKVSPSRTTSLLNSHDKSLDKIILIDNQ